MAFASNDHRVPKRQWRKWTVVGRHVFNLTYEAMQENPAFYRHPKDPPVSKRWSGTTAWNAAWIAADHADEALRLIAEA